MKKKEEKGTRVLLGTCVSKVPFITKEYSLNSWLASSEVYMCAPTHLHVTQSGFTVGSKTKETPKSSDRIDRELNFGHKKLPRKSEVNVQGMK